MNVIDIGYPSLENMKTALESIGFTQNGGAGDYRYFAYDDGNDHVVQLYFYSDNTYREVKVTFDGQNYDICDLARADAKLCYEELSNGGIALGFSQNSSTPIMVAWIAPNTSSDSWVVAIPDSNYIKLIDYSAGLKQYYYADIYNFVGATSNDIQIMSLYNGTRFADNVFMTTLQPLLQQYDSIRAEIGNKIYLLVKLIGGSKNNCIAMEVDE